MADEREKRDGRRCLYCYRPAEHSDSIIGRCCRKCLDDAVVEWEKPRKEQDGWLTNG